MAREHVTDKQRKFVDEYLIDLNATQAAIRAGYAAFSATTNSSRLLAKPAVQAEIARRQKDLQSETAITPDRILRRLWAIATADPNEIAELRRENCRYCWGVEHAYQWDPVELAEALEQSAQTGSASPSCHGGIGFVPTRDPNPDCPRCGGIGGERVHLHDSRKLRGAARLLYAGAKQTRFGTEVKFHDQAKAMDQVMKILGIGTEKIELTGANGGPMRIASELTDDQLAAIAAAGAKP